MRLSQAARTHFGTDGSLAGKIVLSAGLGGMGGAQPLAVTMLGGVCLAIEINPKHAQKRVDTKYLDIYTHNLDEALSMCETHKNSKTPKSIGLIGNACEIFPKLLAKNFMPDLITDQTSAHDPLYGYVPEGMSLSQVIIEREKNPQKVVKLAQESMAKHVRCMLNHILIWGVPVFDYGNNIRAEAQKGGM